MAKQEWTQAQALNDVIDIQNPIDANYRSFFNVYLNVMNDTIIPEDSLKLDQLSRACPFTAGAVVYQARALYQSLFRTGEGFVDNCPETENNKALALEEKTIAIEKIQVFPNPANKELFINTTFDNSALEIKALDMSGKIIDLEFNVMNTQLIKLNTSQIQKGMYLIQLNNQITDEKYTQKVSIQN